MYVASIPGTTEEFQLGTILANSPISFYALGLVLGPLTSAVSELYGRRIVYFISLPLSIAFNVVGGSANKFRIVVIARFMSALAGSPCLTVSAGTLNDIWDVQQDKLGTLFILLFVLSIIWATDLGALIGEAVVRDRGGDWRWTFWLTSILLGLVMPTVLAIPETFKAQILRDRAKRFRKPTQSRGNLKSLIVTSLFRPLHMFFVEPLVWPTALVQAVSQAILFCFYVAYPLILKGVYQFSDYEVGLAFLPLFIGSLLAVPVVAFFDKTKYQKEKELAAQEGRPVNPEARLYPAMVGCILEPISLFW
jgi:MFS family permease